MNRILLFLSLLTFNNSFSQEEDSLGTENILTHWSVGIYGGGGTPKKATFDYPTVVSTNYNSEFGILVKLIQSKYYHVQIDLGYLGYFNEYTSESETTIFNRKTEHELAEIAFKLTGRIFNYRTFSWYAMLGFSFATPIRYVDQLNYISKISEYDSYTYTLTGDQQLLSTFRYGTSIEYRSYSDFAVNLEYNFVTSGKQVYVTPVEGMKFRADNFRLSLCKYF